MIIMNVMVKVMVIIVHFLYHMEIIKIFYIFILVMYINYKL